MLTRLRMDISSNYNLRCPMCTIHDHHAKAELQHLDLEVFRTQCRGELRGLRQFQIGNTAEPLLHPQLGAFLEWLRGETDAEVLVQTNGTLLDRCSDTINAVGASLNVSLDSLDPARYARMRPGAHLGRVLANLARIDPGRVTVHITPVWTRTTVPEFPEMVRFCEERGFRLAGNPICLREVGRNVLGATLDDSLWFDKDAIRTWRAQYLATDQQRVGLDRIFQRQSGASALAVEAPCTAHHDDLMILANGTCALCFQQPIGSLYTEPLATIWHGRAAEDFRVAIDTGKSNVCAECDYRTGCLNPFVDAFRNHVSQTIYQALPESLRRVLVFDGPLRDSEQKALFVTAMRRQFRLVGDDPSASPTRAPRAPSHPRVHRPGTIDRESSENGWDAEMVAAVRKLGGRRLCVGNADPPEISGLLSRLGLDDVTVLVSAHERPRWHGFTTIAIGEDSSDALQRLRALEFDVVVVPYESRLGEVQWEKLVSLIAPRLLAVFPGGGVRLYEGDDLGRLIYNMAYLRSMYQRVPRLEGADVLEIGCSDGLVCDLVAQESVAGVTGVDVCERVGERYPNPKVHYLPGSAEKLDFATASFDACYSIATLEHVADPPRALAEMARVLRRGGVGYVQAGPLYHSPFGHHMFGYFDDDPWIHLRRSPPEIVAHCERRGLDIRIQAEKGQGVREYVFGMINNAHVNGRLLDEYRVREFGQSGEVEMLHYAVSREGQELLTDTILRDLTPLTADELTTHGFELLFRKR